jgi:DNA primase catalytic core
MEIFELKSRLTILEVASHLGIKSDKTGKALCPFHDDKNPSLQLSKEKNIATCFSSNCDAGTMDIIALTEKALKLNTHEALLKLKEWAGVVNQPKQPDLGKVALLTKAFTYFENGLLAAKPAQEYLKSRGITPKGYNVQGIEVGYNSGNFLSRQNKHLMETSLKYGLIKERPKGHSHFAQGCIVFPLRNKQNQIAGLYFRETDDSKSNHHYYLKDREGLYPHYPLPETKKLILTESIIDAATLLAIPKLEYSILACYGTNGLTAEHLRAIQGAMQLEEIIFFFDGDEPGRKGVEQSAEELNQLKPEVKITYVETPEKEDINSLSLAHEKEIFTHLLEGRKSFSFSTEKKKTLQAASETTSQAAHGAASGKITEKQAKNPLNTSDPFRITYQTATAHYAVLGGLKKDLDSLKATLIIEHPKTSQKSRNKLDLYEDKQVERLAREAADKLNLRADQLERDLSDLTDHLETYRAAQVAEQGAGKPAVQVAAGMAGKCREFLSKPNLIARFNELIGQAGVVGEEINRIFLFGIATSYKMPDTLHALVQGSTGSGKTHLLLRISSFIPPEDAIHLTRVTENSFYNYGLNDLTGKLLCMEDLDGMKEEALLAFRELQSRGMLSSSTSGKDEQGNIKAYIRVVKGPIASLSATTKGEIYEDNMSRSFLVAVDETAEQTQRIIQYQNKKAAGLIDTKREQQIKEFIQQCLRMLKPLAVVNPYADKLQLPQEAHKIRRLNDLYQSYVKQITLLNQYRRKTDVQGRLISEQEDLKIAGDIMFDSIILKVDELDGSLRLFYERLKDYVKVKGGSTYENYTFSRKEIRDSLRVSKTQQHRFFRDLIDMEYIYPIGGNNHQGYKYKIGVWDDIKVVRSRIKQYLKMQLDQLQLFQGVP